jgi:hypothetical protein
MTRGTYAPLDRSNFDRAHPLASWGVDRAAARAAAPIMPAVSAAQRINAGARGAWVGAQAFQDRGEKSLASVGTEWFHTVADRQRAIAQIATDMQTFHDDATAQIAKRAAAGAPDSATDAQWLQIDVMPTLLEWNVFAQRENASWWARAATDWDAFTAWQERLRRLRELARARGIVLQSLEPVPLSKTIWEQGATGQGSTVASVFGVLKLAVMASVGILGAATLYSVLRDLRANAKAAMTDQSAMRTAK